MSIQALREHSTELSRQANALLAEKGAQTWSKDDQAKFDGLMDEQERVAGQISAHQRMIDARAETQFTDADKNGDKHPKNEREAAIKAGYELYLRKSPNAMTAEEIGKVQNTMSTTTGSQGGFTVDPLVSKEFIDQLADYAGMRRVADRIVTGSGVNISYPTTDGRAEIGEIVAQNATAAAADPVFGAVTLGAYKFSSKIVAIPIELLQDTTIDIVGLVNKRMRDRIGRIQNQKLTIGAGTTEPFGLVTQASVGKTGLTGQTLTVIYDDLVDMIDSIDIAYAAEGGFQWSLSQTMRKVVRKLKDTAGRPIFLPGYGSLQETLNDSMLGYEINVNNDMPVPAANAKSLSFGQHKKYLVRDAMDVTLFRFEDSVYMTKGQVAFLAWARCDGNLLDNAAVKLYQHSAT